MWLHHTERVHSDSGGVTGGSGSGNGGNAENAQHAQNAEHELRRHSQRQRAGHLAQSSVCVFWGGGGGISASIPLPHINLGQEGGGINLRSPTTEQLAAGVVSFFAGHHQVAVWAQTRQYMSNHDKNPLLYTQETSNITTHCDITNPAPAVKKSRSWLKPPKGEPAKLAANSAAPQDSSGPRHLLSGLGSPNREGSESPSSPSHPSSPFGVKFRRCCHRSTCPRDPSLYLDPLADRHGFPGSLGAPPSLARASAEHGKWGTIIHGKAALRTDIRRKLRKMRGTGGGRF